MAVEIRNFGAVSRSRDAVRLLDSARHGATQCDVSRCIMLQWVSSDRYSRRARITRATQLVTPKYRVPKDVWHGATGTNGPYIRRRRAVNCRPPASRPERVRGSLTDRTVGIRGRVPCYPIVAAIKYIILLYLTLETWLISLGFYTGYLLPGQILFVGWEIHVLSQDILQGYIFERGCLIINNFTYRKFRALDIRYLFLNLLYFKSLPYFPCNDDIPR